MDVKIMMDKNYYKQSNKLKNIDPNNVDIIPHKNKIIPARIVDVYDGDTVTVIILINGSSKAPFRIKIRILDIDTPEIRTKNIMEKEAAILVRDYVSDIILNKIVALKIIKWDKYGGRMDGHINLNNVCLSKLLLDKGYAKPYDGQGPKPKWADSDFNKIISDLK